MSIRVRLILAALTFLHVAIGVVRKFLLVAQRLAQHHAHGTAAVAVGFEVLLQVKQELLDLLGGAQAAQNGEFGWREPEHFASCESFYHVAGESVAKIARWTIGRELKPR